MRKIVVNWKENILELNPPGIRLHKGVQHFTSRKEAQKLVWNLMSTADEIHVVVEE